MSCLSASVAAALGLSLVLVSGPADAEPAAARAASRAPTTATRSNGRLGWRHAFRRAKQELAVYRGRWLERVSDRRAYGPSTFDRKQSVRDNLATAADKAGLRHYTRDINGRPVLHVVVDLAQGHASQDAIRSVFRRVGADTIEVNYKAPNERNRHGHVAVRVGRDGTFDLTGTQGVSRLPKLLERALRVVTGKSHVHLARKRNLRRFLEGRTDAKGTSQSVYFGLLFAATPAEIASTGRTYRKRLGQIREFNVGGGNARDGVYSCAQFLTESTPFFNSRGVAASVGATSTASAACTSTALQAVVVYKMPGASDQVSLPGASI